MLVCACVLWSRLLLRFIVIETNGQLPCWLHAFITWNATRPVSPTASSISNSLPSSGANEFAWRSVDRDNPEKKKTFDMVRLTKPLRYLPLAAVLDETVILSSKVMGEMISQLKVDDINRYAPFAV